MAVTPSYIANHESVVSAFGYWPSFHDARVVEFRRFDNEVEFDVHVFEMTSEVDERRYFRLTKHHRIDFRFIDISDTDLDRFWEMNGNTLDVLAFAERRDEDGRFTVVLDSGIGCEFAGSFRARVGEVVSATPCTPEGRIER